MQRIDYIVNLLRNYLAEDLDAQQLEEVNQLFSAHPHLKEMIQEMNSEDGLREALHAYEELHTDAFQAREEQVLHQVLSQIKARRSRSKKSRIRKHFTIYAGIAATLIMVFLAITFLERKVITPVSAEEAMTNFIPGGNKASLTLSDGQQVDLSDAHSGIVVDSEIAYEDGSAVFDESNLDERDILTLSTPRGGQYQVTLPDGTKVWLNAESKLHYPYRFSPDIRNVKVEGEAYFEVAYQKNIPFVVTTMKEKIEVLGTHFNVNSYEADEHSTVALLEGKVSVSLEGDVTKVLNPGQQSVVTNGKMKIQTINVDESVAWKNGEFMFNNETLASVMQKLARWYDLEIDVSPELRSLEIWGSVSRYDNFNTVLKLIKMIDERIHFQVEGRRVRVMK